MGAEMLLGLLQYNVPKLFVLLTEYQSDAIRLCVVRRRGYGQNLLNNLRYSIV